MNKQYFLDRLSENRPSVFEIYNYDLLPTTFLSVDRIPIKCIKHGLFYQEAYSHVKRNCDCPKCMLEANKFSQDDFVAKSKIIHQDKYNYDKVMYETNTSMVTITCKKHGDFIQRAASHLAGCGCKSCFREECKLSTEQFIENAKLVHGDKYNYSKVKYAGNKSPVEIICPIHGSFWLKPNAHVSSKAGCRFCLESKGERCIELFLKKYKLEYIREYRIMPYLYRYDFYLPELNIFIEFNGSQHYSPNAFFGGEEGFRKTKENDSIKKHLVRDNNGDLVIITYMNLSEDSVEKQLIYSLKRIYKYWFNVDGKVMIFKGPMAVCDAFKLPKDLLFRNIVKELEKTIKSFHVLF